MYKKLEDNIFLKKIKMSAIETETVIDSEGARVYIIRGWLSESKGHRLFRRLQRSTSWIFGTTKLYGKTFDVPRGQFFVGDPDIKKYTYTRNTYKSVPWESHPHLERVRDIRDRIQSDPHILELTGGVVLPYNSCLINFYRDGQDCISPHSDNEALSLLNAVVTVSLGVSRKFVFKSKTKDKDGKFITIKTSLHHGDLVLMIGETQKLYTHAIPREKKITEPRISLTYRQISGA